MIDDPYRVPSAAIASGSEAGIPLRLSRWIDSLSERSVWLILAALCIASRAAASIYYLADPDSLRFALSIVDYDLARLQPHFPGYPIFSLVVAAIYRLTGSYALSFGVVGGVATVLMIGAALAILGERPRSPRGVVLTALIFFNPMLWILGERYMPDLLGLATALWSLHFLIRGIRLSSSRHAVAGVALAGLLSGIRLSYLPLLFLPLLLLLWKRPERLRLTGIGIAATALWLLPLLLMTGIDPFLQAATMQTSGHFNEFGGTIGTEPDLPLRIIRFLGGTFAHGLGFFWSDRHPLTLVGTVGLGAALAIGAIRLGRRIDRSKRLVIASLLLYVIWIFFYQNVVHQTRHLLPLIPFLLMAIATGGVMMIERKNIARALFLCGFAGYAIVTSQLVEQHRMPTAIAQLTTYLRERAEERTEIVADPLVAFLLERQGVPGRVHEAAAGRRDSLIATFGSDVDLIVVGAPGGDAGHYRARSFFHNPYVNPVWPIITMYESSDAR